MATYGEDIKILTTKSLFTETIKSKTGTTSIQIADAGALTIGADAGGVVHRITGKNSNNDLGGYGLVLRSSSTSSKTFQFGTDETNSYTWQRAESTDHRFYSGSVNAGGYTTTGAWTLGAASSTTKPLHINKENNGNSPLLQILGESVSVSANSSYTFQVTDAANNGGMVVITYTNSNTGSTGVAVCGFSNTVILLTSTNGGIAAGAAPNHGLGLSYNSSTGILTVTTYNSATGWVLRVTSIG